MKYTLDCIAKKTGKKKQDIINLVKPLKIQHQDNMYTEEDYVKIQEILSANKNRLSDHVRDVIGRHPFCTESELPRLTGRPTAYIQWLLPYLTEDDPYLAETDKGELFYINPSTLRDLMARGEISVREFWITMHNYGFNA